MLQCTKTSLQFCQKNVTSFDWCDQPLSTSQYFQLNLFVRKKKKSIFLKLIQVSKQNWSSYCAPFYLLTTWLQKQIIHQFLWPNTTCITGVIRNLKNLYHHHYLYILGQIFHFRTCSLFHFWSEVVLQGHARRLRQSHQIK